MQTSLHKRVKGTARRISVPTGPGEQGIVQFEGDFHGVPIRRAWYFVREEGPAAPQAPPRTFTLRFPLLS